MIAFLNTPFVQQLSSHITLILCITFINGLLLFTAVTLIIRRMKRTPAKHKHLIWLFMLYCFIAIPLLSIFLPSIDIHHEKIPAVEFLSVENYAVLQEIDSRLAPAPHIEKENLNTNDMQVGSLMAPVRPITTIRWQTAVMIVWLIGVALSLIRILVGRIGLHQMIKKTNRDSSVPFSPLVETLCKGLGLRKEVLVLSNSQCITPFTCFLLKPVILLPATAFRWSEDRLRIVLLHELAHIQRRDYVSRVIARLLCALFWFMPPVWISYHKMQIEEEKACDASVIGTGVRASEYAKHIIDIARNTRGMVLSVMLQLFFGTHRTLELRIRNILRLKKSSETFKVGNLIRKLFICFTCLLLLQAVNPVTARENGLFKREAPLEMIYGSWVNENDCNRWKASLPTGQFMGKIIINEDGTLQMFQTPFSPELPYIGGTGYYTISDSYLDRKGNHFYKIAIKCPFAKILVVYELWRIDPSGSSLELTWNYALYPTEIDPNRYEYYIFYRK